MIDRPSITLPLCVLGAGIVHGICIAVLLPVLIAVPGSGTSDSGDATTVMKLPARPEAAPGLLASAEAKQDEAQSAPELVTGSIVQAAPAVASAISSLPREDLRQAEPVLATLAAAPDAPDASLRASASGVVLVKADAMMVSAASAAETLEPDHPPADPIKASDGDIAPEKQPSLARAEPSGPPPAKASAAKPKPKAKAPAKPAVAAVPAKRSAAPVQRTASPARRPVQMRAQTTRQPSGLGLFFRKPPAARQPATRR